jgi:hypothetical protein
LRVLVIGSALLEFANAWALVERDQKNAPEWAKRLKLRVAAMSATSG